MALSVARTLLRMQSKLSVKSQLARGRGVGLSGAKESCRTAIPSNASSRGLITSSCAPINLHSPPQCARRGAVRCMGVAPSAVGSTFQTGDKDKEPTGLTDDVWEQRKMALREYPELKQDISCDVVVVGAGITGLSVAYMLATAGKKVVVLDGRTRGSGETGRTTAHIMQWNDDFYYEIIGKFGIPQTQMVADSHLKALDMIEKIVQEEGIDCEFRRVKGYLFPWNDSKSEEHVLDKELQACHAVGFNDVKKVDLGGDKKHGSLKKALEFPHCGNFHPLKYLNGLAKAVERHGGKLYENSQVHNATVDGVKLMNGHKVKAKDIVLATHSPIHRNLAVHSRQEASRSYVVAIEIDKNAVNDCQWWDTQKPYHYIRTQELPDGRTVLVVGGEDHNAGQSPDKYSDAYGKLIQWTRERWTGLGEVVYRWTGEVYIPIDYVPLFGPDPLQVPLPGTSRQYIATGHSGQGMTGGTIAGIIISNYILNRANPWADAYSPERIIPGLLSPANLAQEAQTTLEGYIKAAAPSKLEDIQGVFNPKGAEAGLLPGEGMVVQEGLQKVAVYVDDDGTKHRKSAICPHLGCAVEWNPMAKTFDCVCHGSAFDRFGQVVHGPATSPLSNL